MSVKTFLKRRLTLQWKNLVINTLLSDKLSFSSATVRSTPECGVFYRSSPRHLVLRKIRDKPRQDSLHSVPSHYCSRLGGKDGKTAPDQRRRGQDLSLRWFQVEGCTGETLMRLTERLELLGSNTHRSSFALPA
jgi:hypothetical protein